MKPRKRVNQNHTPNGKAGIIMLSYLRQSLRNLLDYETKLKHEQNGVLSDAQHAYINKRRDYLAGELEVVGASVQQ